LEPGAEVRLQPLPPVLVAQVQPLPAVSTSAETLRPPAAPIALAAEALFVQTSFDLISVSVPAPDFSAPPVLESILQNPIPFQNTPLSNFGFQTLAVQPQNQFVQLTLPPALEDAAPSPSAQGLIIQAALPPLPDLNGLQ